jgi:putative membrane protein
LHPVAVFYPFRSYARPQRLGGSGTPKWVIMALLLGLILLANLYGDGIREFVTDLNANTSFSWTDEGIELSVEDDFGHAGSLERGFTMLLATLLIAFPVSAAYFLIRWWTFRWWIEDGSIRTRGGLLNTWSRRVSIPDIVTIERTTDPIRRLLRVTRLTVQTTAADHTTANLLLDWLPASDADRLIAALLAHRAGGDDPVRMLSASPPRPLDLIAASAFNIQVTRTALTLYAAFSLLDLLVPGTMLPGWARLEFTINTEEDRWIDILTPVVGLVLALWAASVVIFMATFARFTLAQRGDWFQMQGGSITQRRRWIKSAAIQGLELVESFAQRPMGTATLRMRMPVHGAPSTNQMVLHPAIRRAALPAMLESVLDLGDDARVALMNQAITRLPAASRAAYLIAWPMFIVAMSVIAGLIALVSDPGLWWVALFPLPLLIPLAIAGYLAWRHAGWQVTDHRWILVRTGRINTTTVIANVSRMASLTWTRSRFARSPNPLLTLILINPNSGEAGLISRLLTLLRRAPSPSVVRLRHLPADDALAFAEASGLHRSLIPELTDRGAPPLEDHERAATAPG